MKTSLLRLVLAAALLAVTGSGLAADPKPARHSVPNSEIRDQAPNQHGRAYRLHVGLPASYAKDSTRRYPVVYVTDGYWDFDKINAIEGSLTYDKVVPEFITVGIGYVGDSVDYGRMRGWELSPVAMGSNDETGHAADFLASIKAEIIPFIEKEYRVDSRYRVMAGASLGGLFTLFALYSEPDLFQGYIAATPAVVVGNDWLLQLEEKFAASKRPLKARAYVTGGGNESPGFLGGILRYNRQVSSRSYWNGGYEFRIIDGERHAGMQFETYVRGLRHVFLPLAPETGPSGSP